MTQQAINQTKLYLSEAMIMQFFSFYGESEVSGPESNPRLLEAIKSFKASSWVDDDSTFPYCSVLMNVCANRLDHPGTASVVVSPWFNTATPALARSWIYAPQSDPVLPENAIPGDVVIFERPGSPWSGHVALHVRRDDNTPGVWALGANQSNGVNIQLFQNKVLACRRLFVYEPAF